MGYEVNQNESELLEKLFAAVADHDLGAIHRLIKEQNCDPDRCDKFGRTPLGEAVDQVDFDVVKLLVTLGASVNLEGDGVTPLMIAVRNGHAEMAEYLISKGADIEKKSDLGWQSALHYAVAGGSSACVELLLKYGAKVDPKNDNLETPLMVAASVGQGLLIDILVAATANLYTKDSAGRGLMMRAARSKNPEVLTTLIAHGLKVDEQDNDGWTPLIYALRHNNEPAALKLIELGANPLHRSNDGVSVIEHGQKAGYEALAARIEKIVMERRIFNSETEEDAENAALSL